jgi:hypothetical protein
VTMMRYVTVEHISVIKTLIRLARFLQQALLKS